MGNLTRIRTAVMAVFFLLISVSLIQSQEPQTFRIDSYIPKRFEDLGLNVTGGMRLNGTSTEALQQYSIYDLRNDLSSNQLQFSLASQGTYRFLTRRYDIGASLGLSARYYDSHTESNESRNDGYYVPLLEDEEADNSSYQIQIQPQINALKYISGDMFAGFSGYVNASFEQTLTGDYAQDRDALRQDLDGGRYRDISDVNRSEYERYRSIYGSVSASIGYGRQYDGRYAAIAIATIDELRANGLLAQEPTSEQMLAFTDLIHYHFNRHVIDWRIYNIELLSDLLKYLREQGIAGELGNAGPFILEDIVSYYPGYSRTFGTRVRGGFGADIEYANDFIARHTTTDRTIYFYLPDSTVPSDSMILDQDVREGFAARSDALYPFVFVQGEYSKPLSPRWQFDADITGWAFFSADRETHIEHISYEDRFATEASASLVYIFNTRTYGTLSALTTYTTYSTSRETVATGTITHGDTEHSTYYSLAGRLQYRISIPTALNFDLQYWGYDHKTRDNGLYDSDQKSWSAAITLTHWLI